MATLVLTAKGLESTCRQCTRALSINAKRSRRAAAPAPLNFRGPLSPHCRTTGLLGVSASLSMSTNCGKMLTLTVMAISMPLNLQGLCASYALWNTSSKAIARIFSIHGHFCNGLIEKIELVEFIGNGLELDANSLKEYGSRVKPTN